MTATSTDWKCPACQAAGLVDAVPHEPWCPLFMRELERASGDDQLTLEPHEETERGDVNITRTRAAIGTQISEALQALELAFAVTCDGPGHLVYTVEGVDRTPGEMVAWLNREHGLELAFGKA